jgi:hypothetical protein
LDELLALLPDNTTGQISAADMRTIVTDLYQAAHPLYLDRVNQGPVTLPAAASWANIPTSVAQTLTFTDTTVAQMCISVNLDSVVNNNQVQIALDLSGATVVAAGSRPEQVLWAGGRQAVQSTLEVTSIQTFNPGTTTLQPKYTAQAANAIVSAMAFIVTVIA